MINTSAYYIRFYSSTRAYQGGTTNENFIDYLKNVFAPTLREDDILVMDNMRTHHSKAVLRKLKIRALSELKLGVHIAFSQVTPNDCAGWFSSCFIG